MFCQILISTYVVSAWAKYQTWRRYKVGWVVKKERKEENVVVLISSVNKKTKKLIINIIQ